MSVTAEKFAKLSKSRGTSPNVLKFLAENPDTGYSTERLMELMGSEYATMYRALRSLEAKGLVDIGFEGRVKYWKYKEP